MPRSEKNGCDFRKRMGPVKLAKLVNVGKIWFNTG